MHYHINIELCPVSTLWQFKFIAGFTDFHRLHCSMVFQNVYSLRSRICRPIYMHLQSNLADGSIALNTSRITNHNGTFEGCSFQITASRLPLWKTKVHPIVVRASFKLQFPLFMFMNHSSLDIAIVMHKDFTALLIARNLACQSTDTILRLLNLDSSKCWTSVPKVQ